MGKETQIPVSINEMVKAVHENAKSHGWWEDKRTFPELLCLIHSEVSEVLEEYRNNRAINEVYYKENGKPEGIPIELADIVIRVMVLCGYYRIDLAKCIIEKHKYNVMRSYRHGGKKI